MTAELFLNALNAYKAWCDTGKDATNHWGLYELWDEAIIKYAKAVQVSRSQACLEVFTVLDVKA